MSVSVVASITPFDFSGTSGTITVPAGVTASHFGIIMAANANNYVDGAVLAAPAGWTKQADHPTQANNSCVYVWTGLGKVVAGNTIAISNTGTASNFTVYAVWLNTASHDVSIVGTGGGRAGTSSANTVIPGITTTAANQDVIFIATERTTATGTTVTGVTGVSPTPTQDYYFENTSSTATSFLVDHFTQATAGATGNATVTYSGGSGNGWGMMFGLQTTPQTPTVVGTPTTADGSTAVASAALNVPAGAQVGEILLATVTTGSSGAAITPPTGWNVIKTGSDGGFNVWWVGYRVVDGTESASYTWSWTSTTYHMMTMARVAGTLTSAPIRTSNVTTTASSSTSAGTALTGVGATDEVFYFFLDGDSNGTTQAGAATVSTSGYTTDYSRIIGSKGQLLTHATALGAPASPPTAATSGGSLSVWASVGMALVPTGGSNGSSAPTASFTTNVTSGTFPLPVQFTDTSTGAPTSWSWTFGDGGTSTLQSPSHTYTAAGTYTATLTATNGNGNTSATKTITVTASPNAALSSFTDNFSTQNTTAWFFGGTAVATGGQLSVGVNTNYDGAITNAAYNAANSSATVQLVQAPNIGNGTTEAQFILHVDANNGAWFSVNNGILYCYYKSGGSAVQAASMPYNPKTHKYFRISHNGTQFSWQYSFTGNTWVTLYTWTPTFQVGAVTVYLIAGYWGTETSPGTAIWDNYNIVPASPAITVYNGTTEIAGATTVYNGTTEVTVVKREVMRPGITVAGMTAASTLNPFFVAHRGGSADWAEHSMRGNTQSVYLNMDAIEISLSRTSDGVWFGLHDQYLNRTSPTAPTNYDPSAHTWAEISAYTCAAPSGGDATFGAQPYCKLTDALTAYASTHVIFLDPKYVSSTYYSELLNIMDANGGTSRFIAKFSGGGEQWTVAAKARGYKSWGYFYATDIDAGNLNSTTAAKYDWLGMEYNVAASYWTTTKSYGKPVIAHIAPDAAGVTSGLNQGAVGVMVSGVRSAMATYRP